MKIQQYSKLPLAFEHIKEASSEHYAAHGQGYGVVLDKGKATISVQRRQPNGATTSAARSSISIELAGARQVAAQPQGELPGKVNYIRGNDPRRWQLNLATYERVTYKEVYPGIDVVYYGNQSQLEFDLVLKPGADPNKVRLRFAGANKISLGSGGELVLAAASGNMSIAVPAVYQLAGGTRKPVHGSYKLTGNNEVAFAVGRYDRTKALIIDPTISYSTLLGGGTSDNNPQSIAVDGAGNAYVTGYTSASDFPVLNAAQAAPKAPAEGFISKMNASGSALVYSTYIGGSGNDQLYGIAVDSTGAAWASGLTNSTDFPVVGAFQSTLGGSNLVNGVVLKLSANGSSLLYSTYLGATAFFTIGISIAVDTANNAYVTGYSSAGLQTTPGNVVQPVAHNLFNKAYAAKFSSTGTVMFSTFLGGDQSNYGYAIAVDAGGNSYITGQTFDNSFDNAPGGGAHTTNAGSGDAYVIKLNPTGTAMLYFTYFGGTGIEQANSIAVDGGSNAYIGGSTTSSNIGATGGVVQTTYAGGIDGFVAKLNSTGTTFSFVTYLGGNRKDSVQSVAVDASGVYATGSTDSGQFPVSSPFQASMPGNSTSLFVTTSSGTTWSALDTNIPGAVLDVSFNQSTPTSITAATESGIFRTTNGGTSWNLQSTNTPNRISRSLADPNVIYAVSNTFVYESIDDGQNWTFRGFSGIATQGVVADPLVSTRLYAFNSSSGVLKSVNSGGGWASSNSGLPSLNVTTLVAASDGTLYAAVAGQGIYKSTNQAASWAPANTGLPAGATFRSIAIAPSSATTLYASNGIVYKSTNGGANWTATAANIPDKMAGALAVSPGSSTLVYAASPDAPTVYSTPDAGATWSPTANGLGVAVPSEIVVDPTNGSHALAVVPLNTSGFVTRLNTTGTAFLYSSYLAGSGNTVPRGIAADAAGNAFVTGNETGGFPTTASAFQTGPTNVVEGFIMKISSAPSICGGVYPVSPGGTRLIYGGQQTVTYFVLAPSGCAWTASSSQGWATFPNGAGGTGSGMLSVVADTNNTGVTRSTTLTIAGNSLTLTQAASTCTYTVDQPTPAVSPNGGNVIVNITAPAGCNWSITNNYPSTITVNTGSGVGNGPVNLTVGQNVSITQTRSFTVPVGTTSFTISQGSAIIGAGAKLRDWAHLGRTGAALYDKPSGNEYTALSNADGTYTYRPNLFTANFDVLRSGDFNGDGKADMVVYNKTTALAYIGFGNGDGTFNFQSLFWSPNYDFVEPGDLNGDLKTDFVLYNSADGTMYTGISNSQGQFTYKYTLISIGYTFIRLADFNGDGKADLFAYNKNNGNTTVGTGDGLGGFTFNSFQISPNYNIIDTGDLSGDGKADLILYNSSNGNAATGISNGAGSFAFQPLTFTPGFTSVKLGDYTGDLKADVVVYNMTNATAYFGTGVGDGTFNFISLFWSGNYNWVEPGDVNADNKIDVVLYNSADGTEYTGISNGNGTFTYTYQYWGIGRVLVR